MFAMPMSVHAAAQSKRKSVFADDKQAWPAASYKRPCLVHVGRDTAPGRFCGYVLGGEASATSTARHAVEMPMALGYAVPMQRQRAPQYAGQRDAVDNAQRRAPPEPVLMRKRPPPPPRWGDFEMSVGDEMQWWDHASELACLASKAHGVPVRRVGPLVPRQQKEGGARKLLPEHP